MSEKTEKKRVSPRTECKHCGKGFATRYTRRTHEEKAKCCKNVIKPEQVDVRIADVGMMEEEIEAARKAEAVFQLLQDRIAVMANSGKKIPDDVLETFRRVASSRISWLAQVSKLDDKDPVKQAFKKSFWLEIEFGITLGIKIAKNKRDELKKAVIREIAEYKKIFPGFFKSPLDIFNNGINEDVLPVPDANIQHDWDPDTLTVRYYYNGPPKPDDEWEELIRNWWSTWSVSYGESSPMLTVDQGEDNDPVDVYAFIAKIRLYDGTCFTIGQSLFEPKVTDTKCIKVTKYRKYE